MIERLIIVIAILLVSVVCHGQTATKNDELLFNKARVALQKKNCDAALNALKSVSLDGKETITYFRLMGEMQECKGNKEEAVHFYRRYLAVTANDTIQAKVNGLETSIEKNGGFGNSRRSDYKSEKKKFKQFCVSAGVVTGGDDAAYKEMAEVEFVRGLPLFNKHALLQFNFNMGLFSGANKVWFAKALTTTPEQIHSMGAAIAPGLSIAVMPVVYRNKTMAVTAGLSAGAKMLWSMSNSYSHQGNNNEDNLGLPTFTLGARAQWYYKHKFTAFAAYDRFTRRYVEAYDIFEDHYSLPVKMGIISIGVGIYTGFGE